MTQNPNPYQPPEQGGRLDDTDQNCKGRLLARIPFWTAVAIGGVLIVGLIILGLPLTVGMLVRNIGAWRTVLIFTTVAVGVVLIGQLAKKYTNK